MQNLLLVAYLTTSITLCDPVPTKTLPDEVSFSRYGIRVTTARNIVVGEPIDILDGKSRSGRLVDWRHIHGRRIIGINGKKTYNWEALNKELSAATGDIEVTVLNNGTPRQMKLLLTDLTKPKTKLVPLVEFKDWREGMTGRMLRMSFRVETVADDENICFVRFIPDNGTKHFFGYVKDFVETEGVASGTPVQLKNRPFVVSRYDGYFLIEPYKDRD